MKNLILLNKNRRGFTLVELSIVLVIVGILMYGATSMFAITSEKARIDATKNTLDAIERALRLHYKTNGRIPCPADGTLAMNDEDFGVEYLLPPFCSEKTGDGIFLIEAGDGHQGVIATRSLKLPDSYMFDGWGNRIGYAVGHSGNRLSIYDNTDSDTADAAPETQDLRTNEAAYVLISFGKNGVGAWRRDGGSKRIPRIASTTVQEIDNASVDTSGDLDSGDLSFRDDFIRDWDGVGATYFDDMVRWKIPAQISYEN